MSTISRIVAALLVLAGASALAQTTTTQITTQNLTPSAACTAGSCAAVSATSKGTITVQIPASAVYTAAGGLSLQRTVDGTTWETVTSPRTFTPVGGAGTETIASGATGTWQVIGVCAGFTACRVTALGAVTGSADMTIGSTIAAIGNTPASSDPAGVWSITHTPAAATVATITRAAGGSGVSHVARAISASVTVDATYTAGVTTLLVNLRDGASGAGTILLSKRLQVVGDGPHAVELTGLSIVGQPNTAMTLEFSAAGGAGSFQSVALVGNSVH